MIYIYEGGSIIYDGSTLTEEQKNKAIIVAEQPEKEDIEGKHAVLRYDKKTGEVWYEYEDIPPTLGEKEDTKIAELETALLEMSTLSAIQQQQNEQAILELTMMIGGM